MSFNPAGLAIRANSTKVTLVLISLHTPYINENACYYLFSTVLNKLFHITDVYTYSTRQNNNRIHTK